MVADSTPAHARRWVGGLAAAFLVMMAYPSPAGAAPYEETRAEDLRPWTANHDERVLILTAGALYRFQPDPETWTSLTPEDGLPAAPFTGLFLTEEDLWIGGLGAGFSDPGFDDWQRYGPGEGYPGRAVQAVDADDDYAYAATDGGAARFDRYVLEWEPLGGESGSPLGPVTDVAVGDDRVWFALDQGIAEYRKESEHLRVDTLLGQLSTPRVLALRQGADHVWAITASGVARYDKNLETWTSFLPGVDLPDARIHQATLMGADLWLGTDDGLWSYDADTGIWRRDESCAQMPGDRVYSFSQDEGLWVVTEEAFAAYDEDASRWIDFTASVPIAPGEAVDLTWGYGALLLRGSDRILYALKQGESNPQLFAFHEQAIAHPVASDGAGPPGWDLALDDTGLGLRRSNSEYLLLKGGATVYVEGSFDDQQNETRADLTLSGRTAAGRTLNGLYDTSDPDDETYLLSFRGTREDLLRNLSAGEVDLGFFNSDLTPGVGLKGGWGRAEWGGRSEATRRRLLTVDGWAGERRTFPGRVVHYGRKLVYPIPHRNLIPGSEVIRVDREVLSVEIDYAIDWGAGNFTLGDHILLNDDTAIEVTYLYEAQGNPGASENLNVYAGQIGMAPADYLFLGVNGSSWETAPGQTASALDVNARIEHRTDQSFFRLRPEVAMSQTSMEDGQDVATGLALQGRFRGLEVSGSYRNLAADFTSLEDRRTLLGRLREESKLRGRLDVSRSLQATVEWDETSSDQVGGGGGDGRESLFMAGLQIRRGGFPNLSFRRGRVLIDSIGQRTEKQISRAEVELNPDPSRIRPLGIKRLYLRAFLQRSDREKPADALRRITDHAFVRLNGSSGNPLSWNLDFEDLWTHAPDRDGPYGLRRFQEIDLSFQTRPHPTIDAYLSWRGERNLLWKEGGGSERFEAERHFTTTAHLYPGRIASRLSPLSFQFDLTGTGAETGGAGDALPGSGSLWRAFHDAPERRRSHAGSLESRLQILSWLRFIDRWERSESESIQPAAETEITGDKLENRIEITPIGGLVTIRYITDDRDNTLRHLYPDPIFQETRRFLTEWNQTWGGGWLTYLAFQTERTHDPSTSPLPLHGWSPQGRVTYRQHRWRTDVSLSTIYSAEESFDTDTAARVDERTLTITLSLSVQPLRLVTFKLQHDATCAAGKRTEHEIDLRLMIRA